MNEGLKPVLEHGNVLHPVEEFGDLVEIDEEACNQHQRDDKHGHHSHNYLNALHYSREDCAVRCCHPVSELEGQYGKKEYSCTVVEV